MGNAQNAVGAPSKIKASYLAPLQNFAWQSIEEFDDLSNIHKQNMSKIMILKGQILEIA